MHTQGVLRCTSLPHRPSQVWHGLTRRTGEESRTARTDLAPASCNDRSLLFVRNTTESTAWGVQALPCTATTPRTSSTRIRSPYSVSTAAISCSSTASNSCAIERALIAAELLTLSPHSKQPVSVTRQFMWLSPVGE